MAQKTLKVKLIGVSPLLMHNGRLADPNDPIVIAMTEIRQSVKKKKDLTTAQLQELAKLEFMGGLYMEDGKYIIPPEVIEGVILAAAAKVSGITKAKAAAAIWVDGNVILARYDGPKDPEVRVTTPGCYDRRMVKVQASRVARIRPRFENWETAANICYEDTVINKKKLLEVLEVGGRYCAIGDYRPKYGRFEVKAA